MASRRLVVLGPPGVGKGTYGKLLAKSLQVPLVTMSDLIRAEPSAEMREHMEAGTLAPDALVAGMVRRRLERADAAEGYVLDGFPRTVQQAELLEATGAGPALVVELRLRRREYLVAKLLGRRVCPKEGCGKSFNVANVFNAEEGVSMPPLAPGHGDMTRCECGSPLVQRPDDNREVIARRLDVYDQETAPLTTWYEAQSQLLTFTILRGLDDVPALQAMIRAQLGLASGL